MHRLIQRNVLGYFPLARVKLCVTCRSGLERRCPGAPVQRGLAIGLTQRVSREVARNFGQSTAPLVDRSDRSRGERLVAMPASSSASKKSPSPKFASGQPESWSRSGRTSKKLVVLRQVHTRLAGPGIGWVVHKALGIAGSGIAHPRM